MSRWAEGGVRLWGGGAVFYCDALERLQVSRTGVGIVVVVVIVLLCGWGDGW